MKNKIVGIHQPNYIPWLGYFYKIYESDTFVFLEDVQFSNQGAHHYHYIKTPQGSMRLKIPVEFKFKDQINQVRTKDELNWKKDHLNKIQLNYKKAKYFDEIYTDFSEVLSKDYKSLSEQNIEIIKYFAEKLGIVGRKYILSSDLNINTKRGEKVLDICEKLGAGVYMSGTGAKVYQTDDDFSERNIKLEYSKFHPVTYNQLWSDEFLTNVSIIDFLMNYGYDWDFVLQKLKKNE